MTPNPFVTLLHSRKFWLGILDTVVSAGSYFIVLYLSPDTAKHVLYIIGLLQPVFVTIIGAIAYEDGKTIQAGADVQVAEENTKACLSLPEG